MCQRARRISFCENVGMLPRGTICLQSYCQRSRRLCSRGRTRSGRCPPICHGGSLRGGCVGQCARGPGAFSRFGKILPGCLGGLNVFIFAAKIVIEVAYMTVEAFLLSGIVSRMYCRECQVVVE